MDSDFVYSRTVVSWRLAICYAFRTLHYGFRAALFSLASAGLGFAWLCCWLDRVRCSRKNSWMVPGSAVRLHQVEEQYTAAQHRGHTAVRYQMQPRTIDSMMRNRGARS